MTCKIVVIGGGPGGLAFAQAAAKNLSDSQAEIILLEKRKFFYHVYGSLRGMVDTDYIPKLFVPYKNSFLGQNNAKVKFGTVESVQFNTKVVNFASDDDDMPNNTIQTIPYDYLVIATGGSNPSQIKPGVRADVERALVETAGKIKQSDKILVIGGGAVGVEMAGELKSFYPKKTVMLIHSHSELLSSQNVPKLRAPVKKALMKIGVDVILGDSTTEKLTAHKFESATVVTKSGRSIETDAQLVCVGMKPNVGLLPSECLSDGAVKVKGTMEVDHPNYENVFCLGDASNHPTPKMGYWAEMQGEQLGKSLAGKIRHGKDIKEFKGHSTELLSIPIGPKGGATQLPLFGGLVVGNFITRKLKSNDLMAGMSWKNLNAKMPKSV